jgi:sialic acid synthase SpsE/sugar phosphate isomerase/epimerase
MPHEQYRVVSEIRQYLAFLDEPLHETISRLATSQLEILFCVDKSLRLQGSFSMLEFAQSLQENPNLDLCSPVGEICRKQVRSATLQQLNSEFFRLDECFEVLPILDDLGRLTGVAIPANSWISIGETRIGDGYPTFIIAEIGINHNGDFELAMRLLDAAKEAGADCAKFQMRSLESLYVNLGDPDDFSQDVGAQYVLDVLARSQLSRSEMFRLFDRSRALGMEPLCTPWDHESVDALKGYGIQAFKIASADLTNHDLIKHAGRTGKPLLVSTGMSDEAEVQDTVSVLKRCGCPYALLHCVSAYPAPHKDLNLRYLPRLKSLGRCPVGYSSHERGINAVVTAVACGAKIIEKHFTLDKSLPGNDQKISLLPTEFREMVAAIREAESALGSATPRRMGQGERMNRESLAKSLVASRDIALGDLITTDLVLTKSPGKGLQPNRREALIGRRARRSIRKGEFFFESDLQDKTLIARDYTFGRPWGIPVRYHDYGSLLRCSNMDFLEFHLSYKDLNIPVRSVVHKYYDLGVVVHAPDILPGDLLLDPASNDPQTFRVAENALRRCIDVAGELRICFRRTDRPFLIVSAGSCTKDGPIPPQARWDLYQRLVERMERLPLKRVRLLFQTMPPYPWYFGGQHYANLFVDPDDMARFCAEFGQELCFDVSHSKLACNHFKREFSEYVELLGPYSPHLHLVDASGTDGEGLQIDEGEIDFASLARSLNRFSPRASFIPEIWQGHKNGGEGFWLALERLEHHFSRAAHTEVEPVRDARILVRTRSAQATR